MNYRALLMIFLALAGLVVLAVADSWVDLTVGCVLTACGLLGTWLAIRRAGPRQ